VPVLFQRFLLVFAMLTGLCGEGQAQLGPTLPSPLPPLGGWGVYTCVSTSNTICGQALGFNADNARIRCGTTPIAYCFQSY
jgi:hypothetical protein